MSMFVKCLPVHVVCFIFVTMYFWSQTFFVSQKLIVVTVFYLDISFIIFFFHAKSTTRCGRNVSSLCMHFDCV